LRAKKYQQKIDFLSQALKETKEALAAHQAHASFMESEISRLNQEKQMLCDVHNETIYRLRDEIDHKNEIINRGGILDPEEQAAIASTSPLRDRQRNHEIEDLTSQIDILKRHYFRILALYTKLQMKNTTTSISVDDLFRKLPSFLPVEQWHTWMQEQLNPEEKRPRRRTRSFVH